MKYVFGLLAAGAVALAAVTGCQTVRDFVSPPPGCQAYARTQIAQYLKDGWTIADVGPAGEGADYVIFMRAEPKADGMTLDVETWVSRLDGGTPDDEMLKTNGFEQTETCVWDGAEPLPETLGPGGTFWKRRGSAPGTEGAGQQPLPQGGKS